MILYFRFQKQKWFTKKKNNNNNNKHIYKKSLYANVSQTLGSGKQTKITIIQTFKNGLE